MSWSEALDRAYGARAYRAAAGQAFTSPGRGGYTPTAGMILALAADPAATEWDELLCQRRGLLDARLQPTSAGRVAIQLEIKRREDLHGRR